HTTLFRSGRWIRRMVHGPGTVPVTQLAFWLVAPRPHGPQPRTPLYTPTFRQCKILTIHVGRRSVGREGPDQEVGASGSFGWQSGLDHGRRHGDGCGHGGAV